MNDTVSVTARIPVEDKERLDALAESTGRTKAFLVARAIHEYLQNQSWQIEEIRKAVDEAEAGDFASDEEAEAVFARWKL
jgi:RHH-type transcriptional regulator, rel operon repressor / antitoxin RelB